MHNNLYGVLGLNSDATHHQIKAAYRKLALIYHPDRKNWVKDADEIRFKKILEAYQVLSDPTKKNVYDLDLMLNPQFFIKFFRYLLKSYFSKQFSQEQSQNKPYSIPVKTVDDEVSCSSGVNMKCQEMYSVKKMAIVNVEIEVTIDDLYLHKIKRILVWVKRRHANGQKLLKLTETVYVSLMNYESLYIFPDIGDDSADIHVRRGDICVNLKIKPHSFIAIDTVINKYDLWMTIPISLYEYYFGTRIEMAYFGGEYLNKTIFWEAKSDALLYEVPGYGLPYGDEAGNFSRGSLFVSCRIDLPSRIDPNLDLQAIQQVLSCHFSGKSPIHVL